MTARGLGQSRPVSLFEHRAFVRFWAARLAGTAAAQMLMVAIGWQMYELTGSAWDLGLVGLLQFVPVARGRAARRAMWPTATTGSGS